MRLGGLNLREVCRPIVAIRPPGTSTLRIRTQIGPIKPDQPDSSPRHPLHDDHACCDQKRSGFDRAYDSGNPYDYSLTHTNCSDPRAFPILGTNISTQMVTVWHQGKARIYRLFSDPPPEARIAHESTCRIPHEITEMVLAHLVHDLNALKAFSLTCRSWYTVAAPHLHHTLTIGTNDPNVTRGHLKPLSKVYRLGLVPLVKELRVRQPMNVWFVPQAFNRRNLRYFSAFANVQTLVLQWFQICHFFPGVEHYFEQFSPTLRFIVLSNLYCTPRQLSHFLSLFPNLDDIDIRHAIASPPTNDTGLVPFSAPKPRGRLVLRYFHWAETWTDLIALCGGLRFRHADLRGSSSCAPTILAGCGETLETLRLQTTNDLGSK